MHYSAPHLSNLSITLQDGMTLEMVHVEGGQFIMGDEIGDLWNACRPRHEVKIQAFYIGRFPVTQVQWVAIMGQNPSRFNGSNRPVESVSWHDAQEFITRLNELTGEHFRLPTEAEWEYAARGGVLTEHYPYAGSDKLGEVAWYAENTYGETKPVGLKFPNELGLYDMSGNVWEWCQDWYDEGYYEYCKTRGLVENPRGPDTGVARVLRGGSYFSDPINCRCADRSTAPPGSRGDDIGFRLVVPSQLTGKPDGFH